jgi:succinyl-diaminopimelate desuccinylase
VDGENAIHGAAPILARLAEYRPREIDVDGLVYREGLNAVRISGGVAGNVIPDLCEVEVNFRFAPSRSVADAEATCAACWTGSMSRSWMPRRAHGRDWTHRSHRSSSPRWVPRPARNTAGRTSRVLGAGRARCQLRTRRPALAHHDEERVPFAQIEDVERSLRAWLNGR